VLRGEPVTLGERRAPAPPPLSSAPTPPPPAPQPVAAVPASGTFHLPADGQYDGQYQPTGYHQNQPTNVNNAYQSAHEEQPGSLGWLIGVEIVVAVVAIAGIVFFLIAGR
ncbi:MAG: hypothetical protein FWD11_11635, partial [Micrococcales bacterium]|nr:hypothetical protein [Micrococcales bacterium]